VLGHKTRATLWGPVGFATLSAPTLREAIRIAGRFCALVSPAIALHLREHEGPAEIILEERADFGPARDVILFWLLVGIWNVGKMMTGSRSTSELELVVSEPSYFEHMRKWLPETRFGMSVNRLLIPPSHLDSRYVLHDPTAFRAAVALCEEQRDALGLSESMTDRVRAHLIASRRPFPTLEEVAERIHVPPRTLMRRLAEEQTTFLELREHARRQSARVLLLSRRSMSEIAAQLGYSNVANFARAFRRWEGRSPSQYRAEMGRP